MSDSSRQRFIEIETELRQLRQRRRELLEERRQLSGVTTRNVVTAVWVEPIFSIIEANPGISRRDIVIKFNNPHMTFGDLSNILTTLRRRGWIENNGTRKNPKWHSTGERPLPDPIDEFLDKYRSAKRR